ncbi:anti-sigma factor family protein [Cryptosporangium minutisporangium]|uniref:Putative zinc-finger domain-containing protein n=1 Tax=Cryptosporangium minutisporangium TaxID=113569 RepID=A0ABP6T4U6_9ACTN
MTGPRRDPHLGELASAFADDALDLTTRDRVLVHLAHCAECRAEVDGHRQVKARLARLEAPPCPDSLLNRLRALPDTTPTDRATPALTPPPLRLEASFRSVAPAGRPSATRRPAAVAAPGRRRPAGRRPGVTRPSGRRLRRSVVATAVGGVAAFAISLSTVVVLGGDQQPSTVSPPVQTYVKEHGAVTGGVPGGDREASVVDVADTDE